MTRTENLYVQVQWNRLTSICEEQARALLRVSFSSMAGEAEDFGSAIFDRSGNLIAQAESTGTISILFGLAQGIKHMLRKYPAECLEPGDVLIGNDPWLFSGHKYDVTMAAPIFFHDKLVGLTATCLHVPDVGGLGFGPSARDGYEEGVLIPVLKFVSRGNINKDLVDILRVNVRSEDLVIGDLMAQVTANEVAGRRVVASLKEFGLETLDGISREIRDRTQSVFRERLRKVPQGEYEYETRVDVLDKEITMHCRLTHRDGRIQVDFSGTSPQVEIGVNCTLNVTAAFAVHAIKCSLLPDIPNNEGFFEAIEITAPQGSILNASWPAPVAARHMITTCISSCVFGALAQMVPRSVIAESASRVFIVTRGIASNGEKFAYTYPTRCGMGARPDKDGLSGHMFPAAVGTIPIEIVENNSPIFVLQKEFLADSGGPGRFRGGCDQLVEFKIRCDGEANLACMSEQSRFPAHGVQGGLPGSKSHFVINGTLSVDPKKTVSVTGNDVISCSGGGGGGFFSPVTRDPQRVLDDVLDGLVSVEAAKDKYRVAIDNQAGVIDWRATARLREEQKDDHHESQKR
jgi:N-methylhydantoinase B